MSKSAHGAPPERDCTLRCCSRQHGDSLVAAASKRGTPDVELASFARWLCWNCGQAVDHQGRTMLHLAASCGRRDFVWWLVKAKEASINARDLESGYTPLHRSIFYGQIHVAAALMKLGASINVVDHEDLTPLEIAMKDRLPIVSYTVNGPCEVYMWGTNTNYTLGTGSQASRPQPELLDMFRKQNLSIKQVVMHKFHSVFVTHDGRVFSCGHGQGGRLGLDSEKAFLMPCPVKLWNNPATGLVDVCVQASAGRDHTVLLMESGQVLTCGLNTHHQLGHSPPPAYLLTPRTLSQKVTKAAGEIRGICAARFHTVIWSNNMLLTCGLNAGQLGHLRTTQERTIIVPRMVSSLNHKDCHITHVAASDGATVVVMKRGDIYVLHEYQCRKIASRQLDIEKVVVIGGHLDFKLDSSVLMDRGGEQLKVMVLTKTGKILLWQESSLQLTRCIFNINRLLILKDIAVNRQQLLFVTKDGEAFQGEVKVKKSRKQHHSPDLQSQLKISLNKSSAFNEFLDKDECEVVVVKKLPHIHRAVSITSDLKGRNFAVIQAHPKSCLLEVPQVETSDMREHMLNLLQEAHQDDAIHDVEFQVGQCRHIFAAHKFLVASRSEPLAKLVAEASLGHGEGIPRVELASVHPQIFQQILQFIYTNTCDLLRPGPCAVLIPKSNTTDYKSEQQNKPDVDMNTMLDPTVYDSSVSAYEVAVAEGKNKKNKAKQHVLKKVGEDIEGNFCDPIRLAQEAAKKFGLSALHKKLDGVRYENGIILSKNNRSCQPAEVAFDHNKHKELYDVTLCSEDGKELKAHKCVLAARLDYFNSMFSGGWAEAQNSRLLRIPVPYSILDVLVDFLYRNEATTVLNSEDLDFVSNVLVLSDQLLVKRLKEICEVALANLITLKNVAHCLQFSETYNADQLKLCCMQYICLNLPAVLESRVLELLGEDLLECLSKYYCELHPVMSRRIITPYSNAPSDDLVHCVWESFPVSWIDEMEGGCIEEKQKNMKGLKKKPRVRKTSSSDCITKNNRLRNESVSSNEDISQHHVSPISFEELTEKECYTKMTGGSVSVSKDITLSLSKITGNAQDGGGEENSRNMSWVKVLNHSSRQQKVVQARLKVVSAMKECPEMMVGLPDKFTNLTAALKERPVEPRKIQLASENVTKQSNPAGVSLLEEYSSSPVMVKINTENFPELQRSTPSPQDNMPPSRSPSVKSSESRKVVKLSQKQRKKLASGQSISPPADHATQKAGFAWGGATSPEVGSPTTSFTLLDVMKQELQQTRQGSAPIPTPANRKLSWAMPTAACATSSPTEQSSPVSSNPWQKMGTPPAATVAASPPAMSFLDIVADEKKQRDNWTKMRAKPLQLTQLEDKAMEDLLVFYNAAKATDERITVHRVSTGAIAMPVWITSHH